jgi:hypothetical protein
MKLALKEAGHIFSPNGEKRASPTLWELEAGWLATGPNQAALIIPVSQVAEIHARRIIISNENDISNDESQPIESIPLKADSAVIVFPCVKFCFVPASIPFRIARLATAPSESR